MVGQIDLIGRSEPLGTAPETGARLDFLDHVFLRCPSHPIQWLTRLSCPDSVRVIEETIQLEARMESLRSSITERLFLEVAKLTGRTKSLALDLKRLFAGGKLDLVPEKWASRISELAPETAREIQLWQEVARTRQDKALVYAVTFGQELSTVRAALLQTLNEPLMKDGLLLSSCGLYKALELYLERPPSRDEPSSKSQRIFERNIVDHLARGATVSTPRGLLSGVAVGRWDTPGRTSRKPASGDSSPIAASSRVVLSLPVIRTLAEKISGSPHLHESVVPRPNWTLHRVGSEWYFLLPLDMANRELLSIEANEVMDLFIELASRRELTARQLIARVHESLGEDYEKSEIESYYSSLCAKGMIQGSLEVPHEQTDGLGYLVQWLRKASELNPLARPEAEKWLRELLRLQEGIALLADRAGPHETARDLYFQVKERIFSLTGVTENDRWRKAFQDPLVVDMRIAPRFDRLPLSIRKDLEAVRPLYVGMVTEESARPHVPYQQAYAFAGIKETEWQGAYLPFWRLLRANIDDASFKLKERQQASGAKPDAVSEVAEERIPAPGAPQGKMALCRERLQTMFERRTDKSGNLPRCVDLTEEIPALLQELGAAEDPSGKARLDFRIAADNWQSLVSGNYQLTGLRVANCPVLTIMRFLSLLDCPELSEEVADHVRWVAARHPGTLPVNKPLFTFRRVDPVTQVPAYFEFSVESSGARTERPASQIIPLEQLWIKYDGRMRLVRRTEEGEMELLPLQPSVLNPAGLPLAAQFVSRLTTSMDERLYASSLISNSLSGMEHCPRLTVGKIILRQETWSVRVTETADHASNVAAESFRNWNSWRMRKGIPRYVFLSVERKPGNVVKGGFVDFLNPYCIDKLNSIVNQLQSRPWVKESKLEIEEMLPTPDQLWQKTDEDGPHVCEIHAGFQWTRD